MFREYKAGRLDPRTRRKEEEDILEKKRRSEAGDKIINPDEMMRLQNRKNLKNV